MYFVSAHWHEKKNTNQSIDQNIIHKRIPSGNKFVSDAKRQLLHQKSNLESRGSNRSGYFRSQIPWLLGHEEQNWTVYNYNWIYNIHFNPKTRCKNLIIAHIVLNSEVKHRILLTLIQSSSARDHFAHFVSCSSCNIATEHSERWRLSS